MPSFVVYFTRTDTSKEWFTPGREYWSKYFTQTEIDTILQPYYDAVMALPGMLSEKGESIDDYTRKLTHVYDTKENCANAAAFRTNTTGDINKKRHDLLKQKREELGVEDYSIRFDIE